MKTYRKTFDSWDEFVGYLRTTQPLWPRDECESMNRGRHMADWFGSASWDEAMRFAVEGHPVGRTLIDKAVIKFTSEPEPLWDTAPVGAFPCIPAYSAGVPEDMFTLSETAQVSQPIVRIVVNMTASAAISAQEIINRGAAIVTLIDRIQASGKRVELVASEHSSSGNGRYLFSVTVKRPEEPVDMDRIGLVFATPIFLRRFMFRMMECTAPNVVPGYGRAEHFPDDFTDRDLVIPKIAPDECGTVEKANAAVAALWEEANLREAA